MKANELKSRLATESDAPAIVKIVNEAYRGETGLRGWTTEAHIIGGQRVDVEGVRGLVTKPESFVLLAHPQSDPKRILGCVHIERASKTRSYLGMLTVNVAEQTRGTGSFLLSQGEIFARDRLQCQEMEMTVLANRSELIAWYMRRGYEVTGERKPFPYGQERFGIPLVPDLVFEVLRKTL